MNIYCQDQINNVEIDDFKFDDRGLLVAIAIDAYNGEVLMQAFMNREALAQTISSGHATYYSRSRGALWVKGETSGHTQEVVEIRCDCDMDCVLLRVKQEGAACHTGNRSCFYRSLGDNEYIPDYKVLFQEADTIRKRRLEPQEGSYTNYLLDKGVDKICKKVGEEATETVIAAITGKRDELIGEICDIAYHVLVLMEARGVDISDICAEMARRKGLKPHPKYADINSDKGRNREKK